ncbi:MAG TPA: polysaccharide deacetylase family protein, partial [Nitrososphaeraceae archaeon]
CMRVFSIITVIIILGSNIFLNKDVMFGSVDQRWLVSGEKMSIGTVPSDINKMIILTFGDISQTQYFNAKPILDKYGFKGSFFVTCDWIGTIDEANRSRMSWQMILAMHNQGQDIESKAMSHRDLNGLSRKDLEFEIGQSKKCLADHNLTTTILAVPYGDAWNNSTVIDEISRFYDLADNGFAHLMFMNCTGFEKSHRQTDCRTYNVNGELNPVNRFSIREQSHNSWDQKYNYDDRIIFSKFIDNVNSQIRYNTNNAVKAIPIMAYHTIDNSKTPFSTDIGLFEEEMKYLYDNGFKVITMDKISFDPSTNLLYVTQTAAKK